MSLQLCVECDSISGLNIQHTENLLCGRRFGQAINDRRHSQVSHFILAEAQASDRHPGEREEVGLCWKISQSNLNWLIQSANQLGYYVVDVVLGASNFGVRQQRDRVYMICVL